MPFTFFFVYFYIFPFQKLNGHIVFETMQVSRGAQEPFFNSGGKSQKSTSVM